MIVNVAGIGREDDELVRACKKVYKEALRVGLIEPQSCEVLGCTRWPTAAHHKDYHKPLAITWLCTLHHHTWHRGSSLPFLNAEHEAVA